MIWYSSTLTLHSHIKTHVFSLAFCMELLNISRVINFYSQFWCAHMCIFFEQCMCMHEYTLYEYTEHCTSRVHLHTRDTSRVHFVIHLTCTLGIGTHSRQQKSLRTHNTPQCNLRMLHIVTNFPRACSQYNVQYSRTTETVLCIIVQCIYVHVIRCITIDYYYLCFHTGVSFSGKIVDVMQGWPQLQGCSQPEFIAWVHLHAKNLCSYFTSLFIKCI